MRTPASVKKILPAAAVLSLALALVGCSTESPTAPPAQPTPGGTTVTLTLSSPSGSVGGTVGVQAAVTRNGRPIADGTTVVFSIAGCTPGGTPCESGGCDELDPDLPNCVPFYFENGSCEVSRATVNGLAQVLVSGHVQGSATVRATVSPVTAERTIAFNCTSGGDNPAPGDPVIYDVTPRRGKAGDLVVISGVNLCTNYDNGGRCIQAPNVVVFDIDSLGVTRDGQVVDANDAGTELTVRVPVPTGAALTEPALADITVNNGVGEDTEEDIFEYVVDTGDMQITFLDPDRGSSQGGETVVIHGSGFPQQITAVLFEGQRAEVLAVSSDGTTITVRTPRLFTIPSDLKADVTVQAGSSSVTLPNGFTLIDQETPELYALEPNSGPIEGGTRVTLTGRGFAYPVQVLFTIGANEYQATVASVNYDTIIAVSPNIAPSEPTTPTIAQVRVVNTLTGKQSGTKTFRYGEALFISGITPQAGPAEQENFVTIHGQGFSEPLQVQVVVAGTTLPARVINVGGTQIGAALPAVPENARECLDEPATVRVTLLSSNLSAENTFLYRSTHPFIQNVVITGPGQPVGANTVRQYDPAAGCSVAWGEYEVTIQGQGFLTTAGGGSAIEVDFGTGPVLATVENSTTLTLAALPDLGAIPLSTVTCILPGGACGQQNVDTWVPVTVRNVNSGCTDTLPAAIVIRPCSTACVAGQIAVTGVTLSAPGPFQAGTPFTAQVAFTPSPAPANATIGLTYNGFTATPPNVPVPLGATSPATVTVVANTATVGPTGSITASIGSGLCATTATSPLFQVLAPLTITTICPLPGGTVGAPYSQTLAATGGQAPYTWAIVGGSLPAGLTLTGNTISGTPTTPGTANFTIQVTDAASNVTTLACSITVT